MSYPVENRSPMLVNASGIPTRHRYTRTERVDYYGALGTVETGYAHIFTCDKTGAERRYGFDTDPPGVS